MLYEVITPSRLLRLPDPLADATPRPARLSRLPLSQDRRRPPPLVLPAPLCHPARCPGGPGPALPLCADGLVPLSYNFV